MKRLLLGSLLSCMLVGQVYSQEAPENIAMRRVAFISGLGGALITTGVVYSTAEVLGKTIGIPGDIAGCLGALGTSVIQADPYRLLGWHDFLREQQYGMLLLGFGLQGTQRDLVEPIVEGTHPALCQGSRLAAAVSALFVGGYLLNSAYSDR